MAYEKISRTAASFKLVKLAKPSSLNDGQGRGLFDILGDFSSANVIAMEARHLQSCRSRFREDLNCYLRNLKNSKVRNLSDIIQYNKDHTDEELLQGRKPDNVRANYSVLSTEIAVPTTRTEHSGQCTLVKAQENNMPRVDRDQLLAYIQRMGRELGIDKTLIENEVDIILCPADSQINMFSSCSGKYGQRVSSCQQLICFRISVCAHATLISEVK